MSIVARTEAAGTLIAATDSALAELEAVLSEADRVTLHGDDQHDWTEADAWAHLGRWLAASVDVLNRYHAGERDIEDYNDGEALNLRWLAADTELTSEAAKSRALNAWADLRSLLASVDQGDWNGLFEGYARGTGVDHVLEHIGFVVAASGIEPPAEAIKRLERDRGSWADLVASLDAQPGVPLHDPESPDWTSREIFGHFVRWTEWGVARFEAQRDGLPAPDFEEGWEVLNARWASEDAALDLDAVRARALKAFAQRARLILTTPADRWSAEMLTTVDEDGYDHIAEHLGYLRGAASA